MFKSGGADSDNLGHSNAQIYKDALNSKLLSYTSDKKKFDLQEKFELFLQTLLKDHLNEAFTLNILFKKSGPKALLIFL